MLVASLGACGFQPLYAPSGSNEAALRSVYVDLIPNRNGQLLRQALQARLEGAGRDGPQTFVLSVSLTQTSEALATQQDNSTSRERDTATATWSLRRSTDSPFTKIAFGTAHAVDGHDVLDAQFFYGDLQSDAATRRLAEAVADSITQSLAAYFRTHKLRT
jgi:LPS-assembly lipoprotein